MAWFFSWYLTVSLLGWLTFPLAFRLFPALADRGYSLSRALGLLVWGYAFWLLTSLGISQNDVGGILFGLLVLACLSACSLFTRHLSFKNRKLEIVNWFRSNLRIIFSVEALFLLTFAFLSLVRASNPELTSAEKPMELMFINAILRSPTFPPHDAWFSGYAISYYYFGYVMTAMLAKLTGMPGTVAHNLMTALVFALGAIGSYGILYNLLALRRASGNENRAKSDSRLSFFAPLFLLVVSNAEGFLEVLHRRGLFWSEGTSAFWTWLDIKDLSSPPVVPLGWVPERYLWWWRASRVVADYNLGGGFNEIIDEFPMFSFIHADLHPHVLAIPFGLLAIAAALNLFLGGWRGEMKAFGFSLRVNWQGFAFLSLMLGGLAFLNTWDILFSAALIVGAYVFSRVVEKGWDRNRIEDAFVFGLTLGILSYAFYLPFHVSFSSQASGILPNLVYPTRGAHLWVMFATLLLPLFSYLIYLWRTEKMTGRWGHATVLVLGLVLILWGLAWILGLGVRFFAPDVKALFLQQQGMPDLGAVFVAAWAKWLSQIGSLLTLLALLIPAFSFLIAIGKTPTEDDQSNHQYLLSNVFVLILILLGTLLVLGPEFFYLRDQFGTRINTIFKFYYQAWMLWSLAAAYGIAVLGQKLRGALGVTFQVGLGLLLTIGLAYPIFGISTRTDDFHIGRALQLTQTINTSEDENSRTIAREELASLWSLDYFDTFQRYNADEAAAIRWLRSAPDGVVAEAIGGSYSGYARVSTLTGLPTLLGWPGHESQWRGGYEVQGSRQGDLETLYATADWTLASDILSRYGIRYVYVGGLERAAPLQEEKFQSHLKVAFQQGQVTIYVVP